MMIDFDELDKQDPPSTALSRSGSGASLPGERPASEGRLMSRSGSQTSLTSPVAKVPDGAGHHKSGGLRLSQYHRQGQDPATPPKTAKKDLDSAVFGAKEELKLFVAQQKSLLQQDMQRELEPLAAELRRVADSTTQQEQRQKALEDRMELEMTEVTKGMTKLSEEGVKPSKLAEDTMKGLDKLHKDFKKHKERLDEVEKRVQLVQQGLVESKILEKSAEEELVQVKQELARLGEEGQKPLKLADRFEAEIWEVRNEVARMAERDDQTAKTVHTSSNDGLQNEVNSLRQHLDESLAAASKSQEEVLSGVKKKLTEDFSREVQTLQEELAELSRTDFKAELEALKQRADQLHKDSGSVREELLQLSTLTMSCMSKAKDFPAELESLRRDVAAVHQRSAAKPSESVAIPLTEVEAGGLEGEELVRAMAALRKDLQRSKDLFQSGHKSVGVVLSDIMILKQDLQAVKTSYPLIEQLREDLRKELAAGFKSLTEDWLSKQTAS